MSLQHSRPGRCATSSPPSSGRIAKNTLSLWMPLLARRFVAETAFRHRDDETKQNTKDSYTWKSWLTRDIRYRHAGAPCSGILGVLVRWKAFSEVVSDVVSAIIRDPYHNLLRFSYACAVSCASLPTQQARTHLQPSRSFLPTKPTTFRLHRTIAFHVVPSHSPSALVPSVA